MTARGERIEQAIAILEKNPSQADLVEALRLLSREYDENPENLRLVDPALFLLMKPLVRPLLELTLAGALRAVQKAS